MSGAGSQLYFRGALALPDDNEPSLIVDLRVVDEVVVITQNSEQIGSWPADQVAAERLNGQKFRLMLGEDEVIFHARDRLGFAYNGLNAIEEARERIEHRRNKWWFEKLVDGSADGPSPANWVAKRFATLKDAVSRTARVSASREAELPEAPMPRTRPADPPPLLPTPIEPTAPSPVADGEPSPIPDMSDEQSSEPHEPWGLAAEPLGETTREPLKTGRHRSQRTLGRPSDESDDPWAMVADAVLRRDDVPTPSAVTSRGRKKRSKRDHVHEYDETRLPGGLVRRVCGCGEVVIRSID